MRERKEETSSVVRKLSAIKSRYRESPEVGVICKRRHRNDVKNEKLSLSLDPEDKLICKNKKILAFIMMEKSMVFLLSSKIVGKPLILGLFGKIPWRMIKNVLMERGLIHMIYQELETDHQTGFYLLLDG